MEKTRNYFLDAEVAEMKLQRMAFEIIENNADESLIYLAGIRESGSVIARNIQRLLKDIAPTVQTKFLSIALDKHVPDTVTLSINDDFNDQVLIVLDDVASSGKTLLYAMKPFLAFQPRKIQALVLVERSHKAYPVKADYVGISLATTLQEHIYVEVEGDKVLGAYLQ
jgi:pyrimidine operon attenuation protein / uracil phosphoribosyltransferase